MLRREQRIKSIILFTFFSIFFIGVGYALFTNELDIKGVVDIDKSEWNVYFNNIQVLEESNIEGIVKIDEKNTVVDYSVKLKNPGDKYTFSVDAVNDGSIDAMIEKIINTDLTEEQKNT